MLGLVLHVYNLVLRRWRKENWKFEASLGNTVDLVLNKIGKKGRGEKRERNKKETKNKLYISLKDFCCLLVEWERSQGCLRENKGVGTEKELLKWAFPLRKREKRKKQN